MMADPGEPFVDEDGYAEEASTETSSPQEAPREAAGEAPDAATHLGALVTFLAHHLVDEPERISVEARQHGGNVFVTLRAPEEELGKLIGRQGRIARAVRTALMISAARYNVRASLDIEG